MLDCKKMHPKCKAKCCQICPIPKDIYDRNKDKIVREPTEVIETVDSEIPAESTLITYENFESKKYPDIEYVIPVTESGSCCFLNEDYSCNIYEDRPNVCRRFGDETHLFLHCEFLNAQGKERSRQERRSLERKFIKESNHLANKLRLISSGKEDS